METIKKALKKTEVKREANVLKEELIQDIRKKLNIKSRRLRTNVSFSLSDS